MSNADCTPGREPRGVAASIPYNLLLFTAASVTWSCWLSNRKNILL